MFVVIGFMVTGIGIGFLLRNRPISFIPQFITFLIWVLLFLLGIEVGGNEQIIRNLPTLGLEALYITIACVLGSSIAAWGLWYILYKRKKTDL